MPHMLFIALGVVIGFGTAFIPVPAIAGLVDAGSNALTETGHDAGARVWWAMLRDIAGALVRCKFCGETALLLQSDRITVHFPVMKGSIYSVVDEYVEELSPRSFVTAGDITRPRGAVDTALSRLCAAGELLRVRKGLYWKGVVTRLGMTRPRAEEVAIRVGGPGSGPAGVAAAHWLGLTTQVPATFTTAVPIRAPKSWGSVRFTERSLGRRFRDLRPIEIAIVEVLRAGPSVVESDWADLATVATDLVDSGDLRPSLIDEQIREEHHIATRERWSELVDTAPALSVASST